MLDIAVVGTATEDVFVNVPGSKLITVADPDDQQTFMALEYGGKFTVDNIFLSVGGGATNTAAGLARMGLRTVAIAKLGQDDAGERVVRRLGELGIETDHLVRTALISTGLSVILTGYTGDRTILTYRGASQELTAEEVPWDHLREAPWLFVGSLAGPSARLFTQLAEFAGEHGLRLALNPGSAQLSLGIRRLVPALAACTALFLNKREAYRLTGVEPRAGEDDEGEMFSLLHEAGCRLVCMTDGEVGVEASDGAQRLRLPAYRTVPVSTVGAGDAFAAGAVAALSRGESLETALRVGAMNAACVVQQYGATTGQLTYEDAVRHVAATAPGAACPVQSVPETPGSAAS